MKTSDQTKKDYIRKLNHAYQQKLKRFEPVQQCVQEHQVGEELEEKYDKLLDCINTFKWRIDHFAEDHTSPEEIIETSFEDILDEIEWRLREVELGLKGKNICEEDQDKQIARNYFRKSET